MIRDNLKGLVPKSLRNFALTLAVLGTATAAMAADYTMKIGVPTINDPIHNFAKHYAEELAKRTDGKIEILVFPSGQLGTMPSQVDAMQTGIQEALVAPPGLLAGINKAFQIPDAPGFFEDSQDAHDLLNHPDFRAKFVELAKPAGIEIGSLWIYGPHTYVTKDPATKLTDLGGRKIRVIATPLERAIVGELDITGIPMPFIEVLPAIQRGTVDGVRTMPAAMVPLKFYNTAPHLFNVGDGYVSIGLLLSSSWLSSLPDDLRATVLQTGEDVSQWTTDMAKGMLNDALVTWEAEGGTVTTLADGEREAHFAKLRAVGDGFLSGEPQAAELWGVLKGLK